MRSRRRYEDLDALRAFAKDVDVVTFEFENVPSAAVHALDDLVPVRPSGAALYTAQQRGREKTFLSDRGFPPCRSRVPRRWRSCETESPRIGMPAVIKTAAFGYDGKGQHKITRPTRPSAWDGARRAARSWSRSSSSLQAEISVIAARGLDGMVVEYPPFENRTAITSST